MRGGVSPSYNSNIMEKKIIFTSIEPNINLLWLHRVGTELVLQEYGPNGWKTIGVSEDELEKALSSKADLSVLKTKADLVQGKVPQSQLPTVVTPFTYYKSAGGTLTEAAFKTKFKALIESAT